MGSQDQPRPRTRRPAKRPGQPHRWTPEEAKAAGKLGGLAKARRLAAQQDNTAEDPYNEAFAADQAPSSDEEEIDG